MQRLAALPEDVVGDVDDVVDRPRPDGEQALLQPLRRGRDGDAADDEADVAAAQRRRRDVDAWEVRRCGGLDGGKLRHRLAQRHAEDGGELAREAQVTHGVDAVGGHVDVQRDVAVGLLDALDVEPRRGEAPCDLVDAHVRGHRRQLAQPTQRELHRTCRSSRSSFSKSSRMLGMP